VDSDGDGILDDGSVSGVAGDEPCSGGETLFCDDNCVDAANADQADQDSDGVGNACDNCLNLANSDRSDTDGDGAGDACDDDDDDDGVDDGEDNCPLVENLDQADADGDGAGDACDVCADTPVGLVVGPDGCPLAVPGDFDGDYDVDQEDFGHLQACLSGAGIAQDDPVCQDARFDGDDDVDQTDLTVLLNCLSGPDMFGDPHCAE
jgi:hypothetical protein